MILFEQNCIFVIMSLKKKIMLLENNKVKLVAKDIMFTGGSAL